MTLIVGAVLAGMLTVLAPCVLPLLPVTVAGASVPGERWSGPRRAVLVTASLGASVVAFTLLLKATTAALDLPEQLWPRLSGGLLIVLGALTLSPHWWDAIVARLGLQARTGAQLGAARRRGGAAGAVLTGAALGPAFSSCSPLYGYVVVTVLPGSLGRGVLLLLAYASGLCAMLLLIALAGQRAIRRLGRFADPNGGVRRLLGLVLVMVGVLVFLGLDRALQAWILEHSPLAPWELDQLLVPPAG